MEANSADIPITDLNAVKLKLSSKGQYTWEITVRGLGMDNILEQLKTTDLKLRYEYGSTE